MAKNITLQVELRDSGAENAHRLRKQGLIPAIVYARARSRRPSS